MKTDAVALAQQYARLGDVEPAIAALRAGADSGDARAAEEIAMWCLRGDIVSRDVVQARRYLRRAAGLGNVDAAMMEVALTGNGSGGEADWPGALALLTDLARNDRRARSHVDMIEHMDLDEQGFPRSASELELLDPRLPIYRLRNFLNVAERRHIAASAVPTLAPSTVFDPATNRQIDNPIRTSQGTVIGPTQEDLVFQAINRRIAKVTNTRVSQGEALSILRYSAGQQYKLHYDAINGLSNNRQKTVLIYLNDGYAGGQTVFPDLDLTIEPCAGDAVVFDGIDCAGGVISGARHAGLPIMRGVKWLATRWIRLQPFDPWTVGQK